MLSMNFCYVRFWLEGQRLLTMDLVVRPDTMKVEVVFKCKVLPSFKVRKSYHLSQIKNKDTILLLQEDIPKFYDLVIEWPG